MVHSKEVKVKAKFETTGTISNWDGVEKTSYTCRINFCGVNIGSSDFCTFYKTPRAAELAAIRDMKLNHG